MASRFRKRWRRFEVRLQSNARVQRALQGLFAAYINFVYRTTRWQYIGTESFEADVARGVPRVLCSWHEQLAMTPFIRDWSDHGLKVMASRHADAAIVTAALERRGIGVLLLATSGDNSNTVREAVKTLKKGSTLGVTVDGPLGPPRVAKPGALVIAGLAGVEVAPCLYVVSRKFRLKTWDRFIVPLPWGRGVFGIGDGFVPKKRMTPEETEAAAARLGAAIDALTELCEARLRDH